MPTSVSLSSYGTGHPHDGTMRTGGWSKIANEEMLSTDEDDFTDAMDVHPNDKQDATQMAASRNSLYFGGWSDNHHLERIRRRLIWYGDLTRLITDLNDIARLIQQRNGT